MQQFSETVRRLLDQPAGSRQLSSARPAIALPTSQAECDALREWAETAPAWRPDAASVAELADCLAYIDAALPSRNVDEATGERRTAVYASLLSGYSNEALAYMAREACRTLDWFPTPRQCLELIGTYRAPVSDQEVALRLCSDFTHNQLERWLANVRDGHALGDVPDNWLRIAVERGYVRRLDNGHHVSRALYHTCLKQPS